MAGVQVLTRTSGTPTRGLPNGDDTGKSVAGPRRARRPPNGSLLTVVMMLVIGYLVLPPFVVMVWKSLVPGTVDLDGEISLSGYSEAFSTPRFWETFGYTAAFVIGSGILSMVLATVLAWLVCRTDVPGKGLAYAAAFLGIAVPGIVTSISWLLLLGGENGILNRFLAGSGMPVYDIQSLSGMIVVESLHLTPIAFLLLLGPMRSMDTSLEEAATLSGAGPWQALRRVTAPLMRPALLGAGLLVLIRAIGAFEVPLVLGVSSGIPVFTSEIFINLQGSLTADYTEAAAFGTILVAVLSVLVFLENRATARSRRFQVITGKARAAVPKRLGAWRWAGTAFLALVLAGYLLPTGYIMMASVSPRVGQAVTWSTATWDNYRALLDYDGFTSAMTNSLTVALLTAAGTVVLTFLTAWAVTKRRDRLSSQVLDQITTLPLVIPNIVFGLAALLFYLYVPLPLYGTLWIIVVAFIAHYGPYGMRYMKPTFLAIGGELEEAARVSGARESQVARKVIVPLVRPAALAVGSYVFFMSFRELAIAVMLVTAGIPLVATLLLDTLRNGHLNVVGALGTVIMLVSLLIAAIAFALMGRKAQRLLR